MCCYGAVSILDMFCRERERERERERFVRDRAKDSEGARERARQSEGEKKRTSERVKVKE